MFVDRSGAWKEAYGSEALANVLTDRLGTTLGGGEVGREEESEGVVGELHVCGVLGVKVCWFVDLFVVSGGSVEIDVM